MSMVFLKIVNMGIAASWMILAVLLLRLILKKAPKWIMPILWGLAGIRLILPFSFRTIFSLVPSADVIQKPVETEEVIRIQTGFNRVDTMANEAIAGRVVSTVAENVTTATQSPSPAESVMQSGFSFLIAFSIIWIIGILVLLMIGIISYLRLKNRVAESISKGERIRICDRIDSPFILGIIRPLIYLPSGIGKENVDFIIAHEEAHIKRLDYIWKPLGYLLLCVYWFHPLVWVAYYFLCKDIELACDEKVISEYSLEQKKQYASVLVDSSQHRHIVLTCPLAFGEVSIKERVKSVLSYRKPAFWVILVAIVAGVVAAICFLTNPKEKGTESDTETSSEQIAGVSDEVASADGKEKTETAQKNNTVDSQDDCSQDDFFEAKKVELGDIDYNGVEDYIIAQNLQKAEVTDNSLYQIRFRWELYYNGECVYQAKNLLRCRFQRAWFMDLDEDQKQEIVIPFYPEVNSAGLEEYVVLKNDGTGWKELENTFRYDNDGFSSNAFPIHIKRGKENMLQITCEGFDNTVEYDATEYYMTAYESEGQTVTCQTAEDFLFSDKYTTGMDFGSVAAWGIWKISRSYKEKECLIATHGIQGPEGKQDIIGTLDVYYNYDKNGKIKVLDMVFYPSLEEQNRSADEMEDWVKEIALPQRYYFEKYMPDHGWAGCFTILPEIYINHGDGVPVEWRSSGMLTRIPATSTNITFTNGLPDIAKEDDPFSIPYLSGIPMHNHSTMEYIDVLGLERSSNQRPMIMLKETHSLFTAPEIEKKKENGIDISTIETSSQYWSFWYVKPGADFYYILSLCTERFDKEEAIEIAKSVVLNE